MEPSPLAALYNAAPIILWVEDLLTSVYLKEIWRHDRRIQLYVGGGHEVLSAVVEDARRSRRSNVYCVRDRDFGPTNRSRWSEPDVTTFALETFEVECFLLDPSALASCTINTAGRTEQWIDEHLRQQARQSLWWMACRKVLADLREARQSKFPRHPKRAQVCSKEHAEQILLSNDWVTLTVPGLPAHVREERLREDLDHAHAHYGALVDQGSWMNAFSGKELLRDLESRVFTRGRPSGNAGLQDLAKAVAREQLAAGREPPELLELHRAMIDRLASTAATEPSP